MLRFAAVSLLVAVAGPVPTLAQDPPVLKDCRALLKAVQQNVSRTPDTVAEDVTGGCRFRNVGFNLDGFVSYQADEVTLLIPNLLESFPTGEVFQSVDLAIRGLVVVSETGSPTADYLARQHALKLDIDFAYDTDPEALTAHLKRFSVDAGALGRFTMFARLSGFDNTDMEFSGIPDELGVIHEFGFALEDQGLLATMVLPLVIFEHLDADNPRQSMQQRQIEVSTAIRALPEALISAQSAEALVRFVTAFPQSYGSWSVHVESENGLPIGALLEPDNLLELVTGDTRITATADYDGAY